MQVFYIGICYPRRCFLLAGYMAQRGHRLGLARSQRRSEGHDLATLENRSGLIGQLEEGLHDTSCAEKADGLAAELQFTRTTTVRA